MANIFSYATSELSQDAFLCWLFSNLKEKELSSLKNESTRIIARAVLFDLLNIRDTNQQIKVLNAYKQWKSIDIVIDLLIDNELYILAIEDKTVSNVHKKSNTDKIQLQDYYEKLLSFWHNEKEKSIRDYYPEDNNIKCIVYKTSFFSDTDILIKKENPNWTFFDIIDIIEIFKNACKLTKSIDSDILECYISRLFTLDDCLKGLTPISKWNVYDDSIYEVAWRYLFDKISISLGDAYFYEPCTYNGIYSYFVFYDSLKRNELPAIEIQPRSIEFNTTETIFKISIQSYSLKIGGKKNSFYTTDNILRWQNNLSHFSTVFKRGKAAIYYLETEPEKNINFICSLKINVSNMLNQSEVIEYLTKQIKDIIDLLKK